MSTIGTFLDPTRLADLARNPHYTPKRAAPEVVDAAIRTAEQAIAAAQRNEADDDLLTEAQALDLAREEMACTPGLVVQWLEEQCRASNMPLDPYRISAGFGLTVPQLMVAIMAGPDFAARQAVHGLRQAFERYISGDVAAYAKNLQDLQRTARGLS